MEFTNTKKNEHKIMTLNNKLPVLVHNSSFIVHIFCLLNYWKKKLPDKQQFVALLAKQKKSSQTINVNVQFLFQEILIQKNITNVQFKTTKVIVQKKNQYSQQTVGKT